jgi:hypothetical protein
MDSAEAVDYTRRNKKPRPLSELEKDKLDEFVDAIHYSSRYVFYLRLLSRRALANVANSYSDDKYEYRHVQLPKQMLKAIPKEYFDGSRGTLKLLWEEEWRALGITQVRKMPESRSRKLTVRRVWDGNTTKSTSRSHIFFSSSKFTRKLCAQRG